MSAIATVGVITAVAMEDEPIGANSLYHAIETGDEDLIARNLVNPLLSDLGKTLVDAAQRFDNQDLRQVLSCPQVDELDPKFLGKALCMADNENALEALLELESAHQLPLLYLEAPFTRACHLGYLKTFQKILKLECIKKAQFQHLGLAYNLPAIFLKKEPQYAIDFLQSPLSIHVSAAQRQNWYLHAEKGKFHQTAQVLRPDSELDKIGKELIAATKTNNALEFNFITGMKHLPSYYFSACARLAAKFGHREMAIFLLDYLTSIKLTDLDHLILRQTVLSLLIHKTGLLVDLYTSAAVVRTIMSKDELTATITQNQEKLSLVTNQLNEELKIIRTGKIDINIQLYSLGVLKM